MCSRTTAGWRSVSHQNSRLKVGGCLMLSSTGSPLALCCSLYSLALSSTGQPSRFLGLGFLSHACLLTGCMLYRSWVRVCDANGVASAGAGAHVPGDLAGPKHEGSRPVSSVKCKLKYSQLQSRHGMAKRNALQIKH
eukprot:COSAG04_NODE_1566_length_6320_cov_15.884102_4_plen_137_part_00